MNEAEEIESIGYQDILEDTATALSEIASPLDELRLYGDPRTKALVRTAERTLIQLFSLTTLLVSHAGDPLLRALHAETVNRLNDITNDVITMVVRMENEDEADEEATADAQS
jgi:hypothetical protein